LDHDELIFRSLQGRITPEQEVRLREWRQESPEHEERYQEIAAVWRATRSITSRPATSRPTVEAITLAAKRRRRDPQPWGSRRAQVAGIAVALVVGAVGAGAWWGGASEMAPEQGVAVRGEIITGVGETTTTRLADGTVIRLAPETRLILPSTPQEREVTLHGKAFFAVSADPDNPFLVRTGSGEARVLGTRFELDARPGQLRLLVVEGRVNLKTSQSEVDVRSRQLTQVQDDGAPLTVEIADVWPMIGWIGSFLAFESTPLREVSAELRRRFEVELEFDDPQLADETVTVWFGDEPIEDVLLVLCRLMETDCSMDNSRVRMKRRR
jgi:transmembrane sensor